ncbi:hypothetical protein DM611_10250 [Stenotrophomonas maltophilia]|nr:hypothetical protein DM611_10250 [Stenotrophomonas maltophilia]
MIISSFIPGDIVDELERLGVFESFRLFEDQDLTDFSEQKKIKEDQIDVALRTIEAIFVRLLSSERATQVQEVQSDDEIERLMQEFNAVTGVYKVLRLKVDKFSGIATAIIKLG